MTTYSNACSSTVRLNIGGKKFCTTIDTLTQREPHSMLAAMFSGGYTVCKDSEKGYVFIDREGKHFRHILNWLRDGVAPISKLSDLERLELLREAEYYQLLGLVDVINEVLNRKDDEELESELTRSELIKCIQSEKVRLRGVNLTGVDLSKLDLSGVDFSFACLKNVNFSFANLYKAKFQMADLTEANFEGANLEGASLKGANLHYPNLNGANLQNADLRRAKNWRPENSNGANLDGTIW